MAIEPGTKLGPYEILATLPGVDNGDVYKASDSRLKRTVTLRLLQTPLSQSAEIKLRIERDSKVMTSLNHPHISALYDVGTQDGIDYVVTEFLEGETLAQRLTRGPLELDEALKVAIAIADALDKAHRLGMIHAGLNPSNIMLTAAGVKLLNFGLTKLPAPSASAVPASMLSTRTSIALLSSVPASAAPYLAPEQLDGKEPDSRTDIFSFGAVLYEMITGKPAFEGKTQPLLIASIATVDPDPLSKVQPSVPPALDHVVKRCLAKDPRQRLQTAWDLLGQIQWIAEGGSQVGVPAPVTASRKKRDRLFWIASAAVVLIALGLVPSAVRYLRGSPDPDVVRFTVTGLGSPTQTPLAISPDGRWLITSPGGVTRGVSALLLNSVVPQTLIKDNIVTQPFWSPNSRTIGFFEDGKLKKAEASGGPTQNICDAPGPIGGATWSRDDVIVFASGGVLNRVLAAGGQPTPITALDKAKTEQEYVAPYFLPDGKHFLFLLKSGDASVTGIYVGALDSKERSPRLLDIESKAIYVDPGYVLFNRAGTIFAQAFDAEKLALKGEAIRVAEGTLPGTTGPNASPSTNRSAPFTASRTGVLVFRNPTAGVATTSADDHSLLWIDRSGQRVGEVGQPGAYAGVDIAPDGKRIAVHRHEGTGGGDSWVFDPALGDRLQRLTFDVSQDNSSPIWSPVDGKRIAFGALRNNKWGLYIKPADGTGKEELILESEVPKAPMSWSPDGKFLVYTVGGNGVGFDIWAVPLEGDRKPFPIVQGPANDTLPQVSPDGKWIAYQSNETNNTVQIYVRPFPDGPGKWQVSTDSGQWPRWRGDSKEIYFLQGASIMAVEIRAAGSSVQTVTPQTLFMLSGNPQIASHVTAYHRYAVSADGKRFLIPQPGGTTANTGGLADLMLTTADQNGTTVGSSTALTVVLNWPRIATQSVGK